MQHDEVQAYYDSFGEREWERLTNPADGRLEFVITTRVISDYLPANSCVLDIGGGPGRYAIWLAERGHRVTLADLSPKLLEIARARIEESGAGELVEEIVEADACDLSRWPYESFDAALSLGPFYHLPNPAERDRAASELVRVLRPGGVAFIALMPRHAFLRRTLVLPNERHHLTQPNFIERLIERGVFINDAPGRFNEGYGARPEEVAPFFERHGFVAQKLLSAEGVIPDLQETMAEIADSDPVAYEAALKIILDTASDPCILGMANHLLYVGIRHT